jgi:protein O-mannosyl-transferase
MDPPMNSIQRISKDCREIEMSHCRKVVFAVLSLAIILLAIYGNSFDCSWHFDDEPNITDNPNIHLQEISWQNIRQSLFSDRNNPGFPYRPVACLTFALNYYFGGKDVFGYHLVNLVVHWVSAVFLFLFIYHTLNLPKLRGKYSEQSYGLAVLTTFLWAINPVQVQAVTYIVQRMASMAGMFFILSMYLYLKARTSISRKVVVFFYGLCFASFLLAVGSKENAAMLPVVIFAYEAFIIQDDPFAFLRRNVVIVLIALGCTLLIGIGYLYFNGGGVFSFLKGYETARPFTLGQRLLTEPRVVVFYISLLLYPLTSRLNIAHYFEYSTSLFNPISTIFSILAVFFSIAFALYVARKRPLLSFSILFFFINHVIESSIFPLEIAYEHRNYIPSMLFFLPLVIGLFALLDLYKAKAIIKYTVAAFISLLMIGFGQAAYLRNFDWKTPRALWKDVVQKSPNLARGYHNLGRYYHDRAHLKKALQLYEEALRKPVTNRLDESFITHYNLGKIWTELKDHGKAESHFRQAINLNPSFSPAYNNLAGLLDRQGKYELVHEYLLESFRVDPYGPFLNQNLGLHYLRERKPEQAIFHLNRALQSSELRFGTILYLGIAYKQKGLLGRAAVLFQEALGQNPRDIRIHLHLTEVYHKSGHNTLANKAAEMVTELIPSKEVFHKILVDLLATDRTKNIQPDGNAIVPLLQQAFKRKITILNDWNESLQEVNLSQ